jgi:5'-nucleotidase
MARVLVTNDDGIAAPGLAALAAAARRHGFDVVVAAPVGEMSGMSAALLADRVEGRLELRRADLGDVPGFAVAASPAYIVMLAVLGAFGEPPSLVLAGINRGANAGLTVVHSGTVGATLTAAGSGLRGLAVSLDVLQPGGTDFSEPPDDELPWEVAASLAAGLFDEIAAARPGTVLNLNVPGRVPVAGLRPATLAPFGQAQFVLTETGGDFLRPTVVRTTARAPGSDLDLLAEGYATLTALQPLTGIHPPSVPAQRIPLSDRPKPSLPSD